MKWKILGRTFVPYQLGLLGLAEHLHMNHTGSSEVYTAYEIYIPTVYIQLSLNNWIDRIKIRPTYDTKVAELLKETLLETVLDNSWNEIVKRAHYEAENKLINWSIYEVQNKGYCRIQPPKQ